MKNVLKSEYRNKVIAGSAIFYIFSGITSLLNYIFYPIIGRLVSTGDFGEIQFLISMFNQMAVGFVVLNILAIIISIRIESSKTQMEAIRILNRVALIVILPLIFIAICTLFWSRHSLNITNPFAILALGLAILISIPFTTHIGKLQGNGKFITSGIISILAAFGKLIFSIIFILLGLGVFGAVIGIGVGTLSAYFIMLFFDKDEPINKISFRLRKADFHQLSFIRHQAVVSLVVMTSLTIVSVFDSIISRIFLTHVQAGEYAAVAAVAKTILAITAPLMWLALPEAVKHQRKKVALYSILSTIVSLIIIFVALLFPSQAVHLLTGIRPGTFAIYTVPASIVMSLCSLAFLLASVCVCRGQLALIGSGLIIGILLSVGVFFIGIHNNPIVAALLCQATLCLSVITSGAIGFIRDDQ